MAVRDERIRDIPPHLALARVKRTGSCRDSVPLGTGLGQRRGLSVVGGFCFGGGAHADGGVQTAIVPPVDVLEQRVFGLFNGAPGAAEVDEFGLDLPDGALGQGVIVAVADRADRGQRADAGQGIGVADRGLPGPGITVVDQPVQPLVAGPDRQSPRLPGAGRCAGAWSAPSRPSRRE